MTVDVVFTNGASKVYTKSLSQFDRGVRLRFLGVSLPETFKVHFSNSPDTGVAMVVDGENYVAPIPDAYFVTGEYIHAWLYVLGTKAVHSYSLDDDILQASSEMEIVPDDAKSNSIVEVVIPINRRPAPLTVPDSGSGVDLSDDNLTFGVNTARESLIIGQNLT